jgi:hypothetical protein
VRLTLTESGLFASIYSAMRKARILNLSPSLVEAYSCAANGSISTSRSSRYTYWDNRAQLTFLDSRSSHVGDSVLDHSLIDLAIVGSICLKCDTAREFLNVPEADFWPVSLKICFQGLNSVGP